MGAVVVTPRTPDEVKVIQVVQTRALRGTGTQQDPARIVTQHWSFDGELLAESDPETGVTRHHASIPCEIVGAPSEDGR